ncbi:MAG: helix-turn-helix domain-containing protein [Candidatus Micrarchaeota archaeon]
MKTEILLKVGLTENEAKVYIALLELGSSPASVICAKCGIHRTLVYDALSRIVKKGLASVIVQNKKKQFVAAPPRKLKQIAREQVEEKERELKQTLSELNEIVPALESVFAKAEKQAVKLFVGTAGIKSIFDDIADSLNRGDEDIIFIGNHEGRTVLGHALPFFLQKLKRKGVLIRSIYDSRPETIRIAEAIKSKNYQVRYLPAEYATISTFHVYKNKVAILVYAEEDSLGILIENKKIADSFRRSFEVMWKTAEQYPAIV